MDETFNAQVDAYNRREGSMLGRAINATIDFGREAVGKPGIWLQVAQHDAALERQREHQRQAERDLREHSIAEINAAYLSTESKQQALDTVLNPEFGPLTLNKLEQVLDVMSTLEENRLNANQMRLFDEPLAQTRNYTTRDNGRGW